MYGIDLFSLHVLRPLFRPREGTQGNYLFHIRLIHVQPRASVWNFMKTKGKLPGEHHAVWIENTKHTSLKGLIKQQINVVQGQHCPILIIHLGCSKYNLHITTSKIYTHVLWNN